MARAKAGVWVAIVLLALIAAAPGAPGAAAQWTRAPGDRITITTISAHRLDRNAGRPDLMKQEIALYGEYGLTPAVTLIGRSAVQSVRETEPEREFGVGGIELGARVRLRRDGPWAVSAQGVFGVPGSGENQTNARFGEGGGDVDLRLQAGRPLGPRSFVSASGGWRNRRGADQDEIRLDLTGGRALGRGVHVFVQTYSVWSIDGAPGTVGAYAGHRMQASILLPVSRRTRLQLGALATVQSRDMAREQAALISLWRRF